MAKGKTVEVKAVSTVRVEVVAVERHGDGWVLTLQNLAVAQDAVRVWTVGWEGPAPVVGEVLVVELRRSEDEEEEIDGVEAASGLRQAQATMLTPQREVSNR